MTPPMTAIVISCENCFAFSVSDCIASCCNCAICVFACISAIIWLFCACVWASFCCASMSEVCVLDVITDGTTEPSMFTAVEPRLPQKSYFAGVVVVCQR